MPRAAGYVARKCKTTQLRARSTAALRIVFGRSMPWPYGLFSAAACRGPRVCFRPQHAAALRVCFRPQHAAALRIIWVD